MQMRAAEFFAGIGLMRLGLDRAGWKTVWANDIDENKREMYAANFDDANQMFHLGDVHKVRGDDIPDIELATASFPCNDLSLAGARHGLEGTHSSAFWGFIDAIKSMGRRRPPLVLLENVTGFLSSHEGRDFEEALLALNDLGYAVDAVTIDAVHFVPQSRQRMFVIGSKGAASPNARDGFLQSDVRPRALAEFIFCSPEIGWAVRHLPQLPARKIHLRDLVEDIPHNSQIWWSQERADYLLNQMSPRHRTEAERIINGNKTDYGTVFRRVRNGRSMGELRTDGIAGCLRTPRGGSGRQILFTGGRGKFRVRLLTPRECARLMGADEFKINVPLNQALFGFGDAVCVPVVQWLAENYLNPLLGEMSQTLTALPPTMRKLSYNSVGKSSKKFKPKNA
jgi:DNA (cytosine-5)-methyltransferase 1